MRPPVLPGPGRPGLLVGLAAAGAALAGLVAGCSRTVVEERVVPGEGSPVQRFLDPDTVRSRQLRPGLVHTYLWSSRGPWAVHVVEVDLERCAAGFAAGEAESVADPAVTHGGDSISGRARTSAIAGAAEEAVVAGVNGDFFDLETGAPVGPEVVDGRVRGAAARPAFGWTPGRLPWIGTVRLRDDGALDLRWRIDPGGDGASEVVGGFPELLDGGGRVGQLEVLRRPGFAAGRHPRTAVGYDASERRLWLVVVDGRQEEYSAGMTLPELTGLFEALGATEALNLDGGGSTALWIDGEVVSRPSDSEGERPVANALLLVHDRGLCTGGER